MDNQEKRWMIIVVAITSLLMIPLIAMQFTNEVNWDLADFIIAGGLLAVTGLLIDLAIRKIQQTNRRMAIIIAIVVALLLIWAELGVGIFGTPFAGS